MLNIHNVTCIIGNLITLARNHSLYLIMLITLETRRLRGDLIEVFKTFEGFDDVKPTELFNMSSTGLKGHEFKLYKPQADLDIRIFYCQCY